MNKLVLHKYQREGVDTIKLLKHVLLADPPGAGKSCQAITAADELSAEKILVICPASLRLNWAKEFKLWAPRYKTFTYLGSKDIVAGGGDFGSVDIMSYDLATRAKLETFEARYDLLILDESHFVKSWKSARSKRCLKDLAPRAAKVIAISGTPIPNGRAVEAWPLFNALAPSVFSNWFKYVNHFCYRRETQWGVDYNSSKNLEQLGSLARQHFMIRRPREVVLESIPPLLRQQIPVEATPEYESLTESERKTLMRFVEDGGVLPEKYATIRRILGLAKAESISRFVTELLESEDPVVVFAHHRALIERLRQDFEAFGCVGITGDSSPEDRQDAVEVFQAGKARVFLGSLTAANTGITLTRSRSVVMAEYDWVPAVNEQAEGRCFRLGQVDITKIYYLVAPDTLDSEILSAVMSKMGRFEDIYGEKENGTKKTRNDSRRERYNTKGTPEFSALDRAQ